MWSLADLCAELLHLQLRKPSSLRTGNWEKRPLDVDQLFYAAADAYAGVRLWQVVMHGSVCPSFLIEYCTSTSVMSVRRNQVYGGWGLRNWHCYRSARYCCGFTQSHAG